MKMMDADVDGAIMSFKKFAPFFSFFVKKQMAKKNENSRQNQNEKTRDDNKWTRKIKIKSITKRRRETKRERTKDKATTKRSASRSNGDENDETRPFPSSSFFFFFFFFSTASLAFFSSRFVVKEVDAFKAQDFKTCETSSFCNRHRDAAPKAYSIGKLIETASKENKQRRGSADERAEEEDEASFDVFLDDTKTTIEMKLIAYANGADLLRFDDVLHPRYVPKDVLVPDETVKAANEMDSREEHGKECRKWKDGNGVENGTGEMNVRARIEHGFTTGHSCRTERHGSYCIQSRRDVCV